MAVAVLKKVQDMVTAEQGAITIQALPLVGLGRAYENAGFSVIGCTQVMPSGGFIYMDGKQLLGDVRAGLLSLTLRQWAAVRQWAARHPGGSILAVGDVFPLAVAWLAATLSSGRRLPPEVGGRLKFAFIGTAKSEYYLRDDDGELLRREGLARLESWLLSGSVYFPWERFLMAAPSCRQVSQAGGAARRPHGTGAEGRAAGCRPCQGAGSGEPHDGRPG